MLNSARHKYLTKATLAVTLFSVFFSFCGLHQSVDAAEYHEEPHTETITSDAHVTDAHCEDGSIFTIFETNDAVFRPDISGVNNHAIITLSETPFARVSVCITGPPDTELAKLQHPDKHSSPLRC